MLPFSTHPATLSDQAFLFDAYKATLQPFVQWAWGWDEEFQRQGLWTHHPLDEWKVVLMGQESVGGLHVQTLSQSHFVRILFVLPNYQGQGIGTGLLNEEWKRARSQGKFLELKVVKINPAKQLYDKLGFVVVGEDTATYHLKKT